MRAYYIVFVLATVFLGSAVCQSNTIANCTFDEFTTKQRVCLTAFYRSFQKDPKLTCSSQVGPLRDCVIKSLIECGMSADQAASNANVSATDEIFCDRAMLDLPQVYRQTVCKSPFLNNSVTCTKGFNDMWLANHGDPRLCSTYGKAIVCVKSEFDLRCNLTAYPALKQALDAILDTSFNPFCLPSTPTSPSPGASSSISFAPLLYILLVLAALWTAK